MLRCVALQNGGGVRADLLASRKDYDVFVKEVAKLGRVQQLETGDLNKEKEAWGHVGGRVRTNLIRGSVKLGVWNVGGCRSV